MALARSVLVRSSPRSSVTEGDPSSFTGPSPALLILGSAMPVMRAPRVSKVTAYSALATVIWRAGVGSAETKPPAARAVSGVASWTAPLRDAESDTTWLGLAGVLAER